MSTRNARTPTTQELIPGDLALFGPGPFAPEVDVTEKEGELRVCVELPGVDEKDIDLSLSEDALTVRGEKKAEKEEKERGRHYVERTYGAFERRIPLPCEIAPDKANASFKNGVLTVTLPKSAKASSAKKIAISAAS